MERYVETFFRHKWLFIFVLVLTTTLGVGYAVDTNVVLYQSTGTVWAEKPAYLNIGTDWSPWETPAQIQADNLSELLYTNSFDLDVIDQTDLRADVGTAQGAQNTVTTFRKRFLIQPSGTHLIAISYKDTDPKVAVQVVNAMIASFDKQVMLSMTGEGSVALTFYQKQLDAASTQLATDTAALSAYLQAHPEIGASMGATSIDQTNALLATAAFEAQHPEVMKLIQQRDTDQKNQQDLQDQVTQIKLAQSSASAGEQFAFRVIDQPGTPDQPVTSKRAFAMKAGLGPGAGLGFVIAGLILLTVLDTTLRSERLATRRFDLPVLASVPLIRRRRSWILRRRFSRREVRTFLALQARALEPTEPGA